MIYLVVNRFSLFTVDILLIPHSFRYVRCWLVLFLFKFCEKADFATLYCGIDFVFALWFSKFHLAADNTFLFMHYTRIAIKMLTSIFLYGFVHIFGAGYKWSLWFCLSDVHRIWIIILHWSFRDSLLVFTLDWDIHGQIRLNKNSFRLKVLSIRRLEVVDTYTLPIYKL